jgi:hypothetical protein
MNIVPTLSYWRSLLWNNDPTPPLDDCSSDAVTATIELMNETVSRLQQISKTIHSASSKHRNAKAANYVEKVDGVDIGPLFQRYAVGVVKRTFQEAPTDICEQLGHAISLRRTRFLYKKRHQAKLSMPKTVLQPHATVSHTAALGASGSIPGPTSVRGSFLSGTTATAMRSDINPISLLRPVLERPTRSTTSSAVRRDKENNIVYPPPPVGIPGHRYCTCPYCFKEQLSFQPGNPSHIQRWKYEHLIRVYRIDN